MSHAATARSSSPQLPRAAARASDRKLRGGGGSQLEGAASQLEGCRRAIAFVRVLHPSDGASFSLATTDNMCGFFSSNKTTSEAVACRNGSIRKGDRVQTQYERAEGGDDRWFCGVVAEAYTNGKVITLAREADWTRWCLGVHATHTLDSTVRL